MLIVSVLKLLLLAVLCVSMSHALSSTTSTPPREFLRSLSTELAPNPARVARAVAELEAAVVDPPTFPCLWRAIDGDWRLLYSNNAPPQRGLVVTQRIDSRRQRVSHLLRFPLPGRTEVVLEHAVRVTSDRCPAQLAIQLDALRGGPLTLPYTLLPAFLRTGFFDVTYVDEELRISRGPLGELRVFARCSK